MFQSYLDFTCDVFCPIENRRLSAMHPLGRCTGIRSIWPSIVMMISASQGANSTGSAAIAKLCATCARGIRRPPISNSKVTSAECPNFGAIMPNTHNELYLRALQYCSEHDSELDMEKSFGFGVHGSVFACLRATSNVKTALKIHGRSKRQQLSASGNGFGKCLLQNSRRSRLNR